MAIYERAIIGSGRQVAERDFRSLRDEAAKYPNFEFIAISHSSQESMKKWLKDVGGKGDVTVIVDDSRQLYADWGLGPASWGHLLSPGGLSAVYSLGKEKGIWNRPTESGSRWQTAGSFAIDGSDQVKWNHKPERADKEPKWQEAINSLAA